MLYSLGSTPSFCKYAIVIKTNEYEFILLLFSGNMVLFQYLRIMANCLNLVSTRQ